METRAIPWEKVGESIARLRELVSELNQLQAELRPEIFPAGKEEAVAAVRTKLERAAREAGLALKFADTELRQMAMSDPSSELALDLLRMVLKRARTTLYELEESWSEVDQILTDYFVARELDKGPPLEDYWTVQWGADRDLAKLVVNAILSSTAGPRIAERDKAILRLKYERGLTQQQIAELVNMSQSTVAVRLARFEDLIAQRLAPEKVRSILAAEGFGVEAGAGPWDFTARRGDLNVAIEVKIAPDDSGPRSRVAPRGISDAQGLMRLQRIARHAVPDEISAFVVAVYYRNDGAIGFYRLEDLVELLRDEDDLILDSRLRSRLEPSGSLLALLKEGGDAEST